MDDFNWDAYIRFHRRELAHAIIHLDIPSAQSHWEHMRTLQRARKLAESRYSKRNPEDPE